MSILRIIKPTCVNAFIINLYDLCQLSQEVIFFEPKTFGILVEKYLDFHRIYEDKTIKIEDTKPGPSMFTHHEYNLLMNTAYCLAYQNNISTFIDFGKYVLRQIEHIILCLNSDADIYKISDYVIEIHNKHASGLRKFNMRFCGILNMLAIDLEKQVNKISETIKFVIIFKNSLYIEY